MSVPVLHDLEFIRKAFPQIQLPDSWEISNSKSDDVIWNIVLAYLTSFPPTDMKELRKRMERLTGLQEVGKEFNIFNQSFSPFLYQYECFSGEYVSNEVAKFRKQVEDRVEKDEKLSRILAKNFAYLEASSKLLSCNIVLVSSRCQDKFLVNVFPVKTPGNPQRYYQNAISLFNNPKITNSNKNRQYQFTFGMPKDIGLDKKRLALEEILFRLRRIQNPIENISKVSALPGIIENVLISLIENKFLHLIHSIYKYPDILSKLAAAGFETDPRAKDSSGKSAFYHALKAEDSAVVFFLYDYAANNCFKNDSRTFVDSLLCLQEDFALLKKELESEEIGVKSRSLLKDLCRFNEFHINIYRSIDNIRMKYDDQICSEYEALRRKESLSTLLKICETFYDEMHRKPEDVRKSVDECRFVRFHDRMEYYDKLDITVAVTFFDNLFLLQERRLIPNNAFLDVQSDYLVFVSLRAFFKQTRKNNLFLSVYPCVRFHERLSLQRRLCSFKEILDEQKFSEYNTGHVLTLSNLPQIYDNFLLFRIQYYLNAATTVESRDPKSILVIVRCLQVLEESVRETDFNCVQTILSLALPSNLITNFKKISKKLAKLQCINNLPEDLKLFEEIQRDLTNLRHFLFPIFSFHKYEIKSFFLLQLKEQLALKKNRQLESRCDCTWEYRKSIEDEIKNLNRKKPTVTLKTGGYFMCILHNMVSAIREVLKTQKTPINEKEIEKLDIYFLCLESILRHLFKDEDLKEFAEIMNRRKSSFVEMRLKSGVHRTNIPGGNETITKHRTSDIPYSCHRLNDTTANREIIAQAHAGLETNEEILKRIKLKKVASSSPPDAIHKKEVEKVPGHSRIVELLQTALIGKVDSSGTTPSDHDKKVEAPAEIAEVKAKTDIEIIQQFVNEYVEIAYKLRIKPKNNFNFINIEGYALKLEGKTYLSHSTMQKIRDIGSDYSRLAEEFEEIERWKLDQTMDEPQKRTEREIEDQSSVSDDGDSAEHKMAIKRKEIIKKESDSLDKNLGIPSPTEKIVLKSEEAEYLETQTKQKIAFQNRKIKNHRFGFFQNRIKMLKNILISSDKATDQLWEKATTFREKLQLKNKIVQLYLEDYTIQISVEMLLFDFMNVLRSKELKQLWGKTTNLLGGINLRRLLASDNSIPTWDSEPSSRFLEPYDLASELVEKMLKLLSDEHVVDCMQQVLEQSGKEFSNFMQVMDDTRNEEFKNLREEILECDNWEEYALLIAS